LILDHLPTEFSGSPVVILCSQLAPGRFPTLYLTNWPTFHSVFFVSPRVIILVFACLWSFALTLFFHWSAPRLPKYYPSPQQGSRSRCARFRLLGVIIHFFPPFQPNHRLISPPLPRLFLFLCGFPPFLQAPVRYELIDPPGLNDALINSLSPFLIVLWLILRLLIAAKQRKFPAKPSYFAPPYPFGFQFTRMAICCVPPLWAPRALSPNLFLCRFASLRAQRHGLFKTALWSPLSSCRFSSSLSRHPLPAIPVPYSGL